MSLDDAGSVVLVIGKDKRAVRFRESLQKAGLRFEGVQHEMDALERLETGRHFCAIVWFQTRDVFLNRVLYRYPLLDRASLFCVPASDDKPPANVVEKLRQLLAAGEVIN